MKNQDRLTAADKHWIDGFLAAAGDNELPPNEWDCPCGFTHISVILANKTDILYNT